MAGIMQRWKGKVMGALGQFKVLQIVAGGALSTLARAGGLLTNTSTTVGSAATNVLQTLMSYSIPAGLLDNAGRGLYIRAFGRKAANAAPISLKLAVGGNSITSATDTQNAAVWMLEAYVFKTASNAQRSSMDGQIGTTFIAPKSQTDTSVDTNAITVTVSTTDASAAQSNVLQDGLLIEMF